VQELTTREVQVLARTAASFFDSIPLVEFTTALLPQSARGLRKIRHRVLHRTVHNSDTGMLIRALLLGRDGGLRLFSARSADSRDLLLILEPGRTLPIGVMRDVVDWTPTLRVPGFRPFEILDRLSHSLDSVEEQLDDAEQRVQVQKAALASGDLTLLLPGAASVRDAADAAVEAAFEALAPPGQAHRAIPATTSGAPVEPKNAPAPSSAPDPFTMFDLVEAVAAKAEVQAAVPPRPGALPTVPDDVEPDEWDDPVEPPMQRPASGPGGAAARSLFPVMPAPR
jgi:hypothetical protein